MNIAISTRGRFQGVGQILAFNRGWYVTATLVAIAVATALVFLPLPDRAAVVLSASLGMALVWTAVSLLVSHWVYDCSDFRNWNWIEDALPSTPSRWCSIHAGLDECSAALRTIFPSADGTVLDIFDPAVMTEPSILRARALQPGGKSRSADFRRLPLPTGSMDAVLVVFSAHELRSHEARRQLFAEICRVLRSGGRVIVAEHLRDAANICAFGPGAWHFLPRKSWLKAFVDSGLEIHHEFTLTAFVRVFVLRRIS